MINDWFQHRFRGKPGVGGPEVTQYDLVAAAIHALAARSYILAMQREINVLMDDFHHFRPVIEYQKITWNDEYRELWDEWESLSADQQKEIKRIHDVVRKKSKVIRTLCRAMTVLLGGHFDTVEKYDFLFFDFAHLQRG